MSHIKKSANWAGKELVIETGKVAKHADGSVLVRYGDTVVLCTAVCKKEAKKDIDFLPLTVNYVEKFYASGKIPGGFKKREGQPSKRETLISRLIDRPIRPMFDEGFFNEVQVMCTVLSFDEEVDSDIAAFIGASAALYISDIPFSEPLAAAKVGMVDGKFVLNPTVSELKKSVLDLTICGTKDSLLMIESSANEIPESDMLGALEFGHKNFAPVIKLLEELRKESGKEKWKLPEFDLKTLSDNISKDFGKDLEKCYKITVKQERLEAIKAVKAKAEEKYLTEDNAILFQKSFKAVQQQIVRAKVVAGTRIDGRKLEEIRDINCETNILPKVHGSALFTRGGTQALSVITLGGDSDAQVHDDMTGDRKENFMLNYNFPQFSVGEVGMLRAPGRREIGHGELANKGLAAVLNFQNHNEFLYPTIRAVVEILESDGSSSMATVCSTSLALMASGIPMHKHAAGIAMGLIKEGEKFAVISDITGEEDSLGDMDFKVVGTEEGVTALQMDIKIRGISFDIMKSALDQAKDGRLHILGIMNKAIPESNSVVNKTAPVIRKMQIDPSRIREIIGAGGKNIKHICEVSSASIDIQDDGTLLITSASHESYATALEEINKILNAEKSGPRRGGPGGGMRSGGYDRDRKFEGRGGRHSGGDRRDNRRGDGRDGGRDYRGGDNRSSDRGDNRGGDRRDNRDYRGGDNRGGDRRDNRDYRGGDNRSGDRRSRGEYNSKPYSTEEKGNYNANNHNDQRTSRRGPSKDKEDGASENTKKRFKFF